MTGISPDSVSNQGSFFLHATSGELVPPSAQVPVEREAPYAVRQIQVKSAFEIDRGGFKVLPVDLGAALLERKHDDIAVRSHLQHHEVITKYSAYLQKVLGATSNIATHIDDEHAFTGEATAGILVKFDGVKLRRNPCAITSVRQDDILARRDVGYVGRTIGTDHAKAVIVRGNPEFLAQRDNIGIRFNGRDRGAA